MEVLLQQGAGGKKKPSELLSDLSGGTTGLNQWLPLRRRGLSFQQELTCAIQVVGVDEIYALGQHLAPEHGLVGRAQNRTRRPC